MAVVYILRGACGRYYIGFTETLDRRLEEHRRGSNHTTARFEKPLTLEISYLCASGVEGRKLERKLKVMKNPRRALDYLRNIQKSSPA